MPTGLKRLGGVIWANTSRCCVGAGKKANCRTYGFRVKYGDVKWPEKLWGLRIGHRACKIRSQGDFKAQIEKDREALAKIEFCFESSIVDRDWGTRVLPSLRIYRQEFGNCDVPNQFVVSDYPPWPKAAAGLRLGLVVTKMRAYKHYSKQCARDADVLKKLGFVWDHFWEKWNDRIFPAFAMFTVVKGHGNIPQSFVVPCTTPWPEKSHGLRIGELFNNIRCQGHHFDHIARGVDRLASLGFEFPIVEKRCDQRVEPMLATFEELHGHRDVPIDFVVPSEAPWKEMDWGYSTRQVEAKVEVPTFNKFWKIRNKCKVEVELSNVSTTIAGRLRSRLVL